MKEDEQRFLIDVYKRTLINDDHRNLPFPFNLQYERVSPRTLINEPDFYMNYKRAWYLLEKWSTKRWYEWGVTMDLGWLTDEGKHMAQTLEVTHETTRDTREH